MVGSSLIERFRGRGDWYSHRNLWIVVATVLILMAVASVWLSTRNAASAGRHLEIVNELQVLARDVSSSALLAMGGDAAAFAGLREHSARVDSALDVLIHGGEYRGVLVPPAPGTIQSQLNNVTVHWAEVRRRAEAILVLDPNPGTPAPGGVDRSRLPEQRPGTEGLRDKRMSPSTSSTARPAFRATAVADPARARRGTESGWAGISLLKEGHALAAAADSLRGDMEAQRAYYQPWMLIAGLACVLGALAAMTAFGAAVRSGRASAQRSVAPTDAAILETLRPAMKVLHVDSKGAAQSEPLVLGRGLSDAILEVVDGMRSVVSGLNAATAKANRSALVGHRAAQSLAAAAQQEAAAGASLRAAARRIVAAHGVVAARVAEAQQQCVRTLDIVRFGLETAKNSVRLADQIRDRLHHATKSSREIAALNNEIARSLREFADRSTYAVVPTLSAGIADPHGEGEMTAFAGDGQSHLGSPAVALERVLELVRRLELESGAFAERLERAASGAIDQARNADDGSRALADAETEVQRLAGTVGAITRLAAGSESSPLLSAMDDLVKQLTDTAASAQRVLDTTRGAAEGIEELAKLLSDLKPT